MPISLDIRPLGVVNRLVRNLGALIGLCQRPTAIYADLGQDWLALVERGFALETDPYGARWKQSKRAAATGTQTLTDTRALRRSFQARQEGSRFLITTNIPYAAKHQRGDPSQNLAQRAMLPLSERGLPPEWQRALEERTDSGFLNAWRRY